MAEQNDQKVFMLAFHGPLTFANFIGIRSKLDAIPPGRSVLLDFSMCSHMDHTVARRLSEFESKYVAAGGRVERFGKGKLAATTRHRLSAHLVTQPKEVQENLDPEAVAFVLVRTERCKRCLAMAPDMVELSAGGKTRSESGSEAYATKPE